MGGASWFGCEQKTWVSDLFGQYYTASWISVKTRTVVRKIEKDMIKMKLWVDDFCVGYLKLLLHS